MIRFVVFKSFGFYGVWWAGWFNVVAVFRFGFGAFGTDKFPGFNQIIFSQSIQDGFVPGPISDKGSKWLELFHSYVVQVFDLEGQVTSSGEVNAYSHGKRNLLVNAFFDFAFRPIFLVSWPHLFH